MADAGQGGIEAPQDILPPNTLQEDTGDNEVNLGSDGHHGDAEVLMQVLMDYLMMMVKAQMLMEQRLMMTTMTKCLVIH